MAIGYVLTCSSPKAVPPNPPGSCNVPLVWTSVGSLWTEMMPPLSVADAFVILVPGIVLFAIAWVFRLLRRAVEEH